MKKEKSPILVVLCILFLLLFIVLPPVFRTYLPKEENGTQNVVQDKLEVLSCTKTSISEMYQATSKTKYRNGNIESNVVRFEKLLQIPENYSETGNPRSQVTINTEMIKLSSVYGINVNTIDNLTTYTIDSTLIEQYPNDEILQKYFQDIDNQKVFYESMDYLCTVMES